MELRSLEEAQVFIGLHPSESNMTLGMYISKYAWNRHLKINTIFKIELSNCFELSFMGSKFRQDNMQQIYWRVLLGLIPVGRGKKAGLVVGEVSCDAVTELPMLPLLASDSVRLG